MSDEPPSWFTKFMHQLAGAGASEQATAECSNASKRPTDDSAQAPPSKTLKSSSKGTVPPKAHGPPASKDYDEDEFDIIDNNDDLMFEDELDDQSLGRKSVPYPHRCVHILLYIEH